MGGLTTRARIAVAAVVALVVAVLAVVVLGGGDDGQGDEHASPASTTTAATVPGTDATSTTASSVPPPSTTVPPPTPAPPTTAAAPTSTTAPSQEATSTTAAPAGPAVLVQRGGQTAKVVALTFDAGSDTGHAAAVLDTLGANGVPATFGMTGRWAEQNPSLVRRMVTDGHQLVNHSYDHPSFTGQSTGSAPLSRAARLDQLARADAAVRAAAGVTMTPWFRPPYGDEDPSVRTDIAVVGYRYELLWTVDSLGWQGAAADQIVRRCLERSEPGAIYLFHVGSASADHAALQAIIDGLRERGFGFTTATGLLAA